MLDATAAIRQQQQRLDNSIKFGLKHCSKSLKQLIGTGSNDGGEVELSRDPTAATMGNQPIWPEVAAGMLASL
jgi:hypothetical protein